jgi:hypothetical protein
VSRLTPSTRASSLTTSSGAQSTTVSTPAGATWAVISFVWGSLTSNNAPTSVTLDGQTATKIVSTEVAGSDCIAIYRVSGFSTGASKTLAWTAGNTYTALNAGIEYRDGTPTYGATDADFGGSGTLTSVSLANSNGDEILAAYIAETNDISGFGSGQTQLDGTAGSLFYGFTTETGTGVSDVQSFTSSNNKGYAVVVVTVAAAGTRQTIMLTGVGS